MQNRCHLFMFTIDAKHDPKRVKDIGLARLVALSSVGGRGNLNGTFYGRHGCFKSGFAMPLYVDEIKMIFYIGSF